MDTTTSLKEQLLKQEAAVFEQIPGMTELRSASTEEACQLVAIYPDAAFALMVIRCLHMGDREQKEINLRAYASILQGVPIPAVRFRYDRDQDAYLKNHNWD